MDVVNSTVLRNNLAASLVEVEKKRDYLLVSKRGKISSALVNIDLFEDLLALSNRKYLASIRKARREYRAGKVFSHEQLFGEV